MLPDLQHALAIGGLGTLTLVMIVRTSAARAVPSAAVPRAVGAIAVAVSGAALARVVAPFLEWPSGHWALAVSSVLWSGSAAAALTWHFKLVGSGTGATRG